MYRYIHQQASSLRKSVLALALLLSTCSLLAQTFSFDTSSVHKDEATNIFRCATPEPTQKEAASVRQALERWIEQHGRSPFNGTETIPIAFHVVRLDDGSADVSDEQIHTQLEVLNDAFVKAGFQFILNGIKRVNNTRWSTHDPGTSEEVEMKQALAVAPVSTLNFYLCDLTSGLLFYAVFPGVMPRTTSCTGLWCGIQHCRVEQTFLSTKATLGRMK